MEINVMKTALSFIAGTKMIIFEKVKSQRHGWTIEWVKCFDFVDESPAQQV